MLIGPIKRSKLRFEAAFGRLEPLKKVLKLQIRLYFLWKLLKKLRKTNVSPILGSLRSPKLKVWWMIASSSVDIRSEYLPHPRLSSTFLRKGPLRGRKYLSGDICAINIGALLRNAILSGASLLIVEHCFAMQEQLGAFAPNMLLF